VQTWIMAGIAVGMLAIMLLVGRPDPPARNVPSPAAAQAPSADRVRDYQERLRALEAQALREAQAAGAPAPVVPIYEEPQSAPAPDPLVAERKRREYESLFASNVVLSRRPEGQRPDAGKAAATTSGTAATGAGRQAASKAPLDSMPNSFSMRRPMRSCCSASSVCRRLMSKRINRARASSS
jgi:hypothetical protein